MVRIEGSTEYKVVARWSPPLGRLPSSSLTPCNNATYGLPRAKKVRSQSRCTPACRRARGRQGQALRAAPEGPSLTAAARDGSTIVRAGTEEWLPSRTKEWKKVCHADKLSLTTKAPYKGRGEGLLRQFPRSRCAATPPHPPRYARRPLPACGKRWRPRRLLGACDCPPSGCSVIVKCVCRRRA